MSIILNDNIRINAGKPSEAKYLSSSNTAYASIAAVNSAVSIAERHRGLTVNILGIEYWYKNGVTDVDLIEKKYDTVIPTGDFVTGGTNLGFFTGFTGVQILPIVHATSGATFSGNYYSLYNNYFKGNDGKIHIGTPKDGINKRGYVKTVAPVKSWIWNEYTGSSNTVGWILINGNISDQIGTAQDGVAYYPPSTAHVHTSWITGQAYNSLSNVTVGRVVGSLTTGSTLTVGAPVFAFKDHNSLHLRTIISKTPASIQVYSDETFIYISGSTTTPIANANNGLTAVGQTVKLGGTLTGTTTIIDGRAAGSRAGIEYGGDYSASFTSRSLVDKGWVESRLSSIGIGSGERISRIVCKVGHGYGVNTVIGFSGGTYNKAIADGNYDGEVLGIVSKCLNSNCFELTQAGFVSGLTGLVENITYFLSDTVAGCLQCTEPVTSGHISKSMLIATSASNAWVLPYAGVYITEGADTVGGPLIKNVCLPSSPTYLMQNNDFFVGVSGGSTVILPSSPSVGMVVVVADISNSALCNPISVAGSVVGCTSTSCINSNSGSLSYIFNGSRWNVFAFAPAMV